MEAAPMMLAVAIDQFGGPETLCLRKVRRPEVGPTEVLIRVAYAGLGQWDPFEREGGYAKMSGQPARFPYILGSEGAGTIVEVGTHVAGLQPGDRVCAVGFLNPKGGFYAQYTVVDANLVLRLPASVDLAAAAVASGVGLTALRGIADVLRLTAGETLLVHGASGGIGHLAVQLAKRRGARVLAIASGQDGTQLAKDVGADAAIDGRSENVDAALRKIAPEGVQAMLLTAAADASWLNCLRPEGRIALPSGVPEPAAPPGVNLLTYNGDPDAGILRAFGKHLLEEPRLQVHVGARFPLADVAAAHAALERHHLGKMVLIIP